LQLRGDVRARSARGTLTNLPLAFERTGLLLPVLAPPQGLQPAPRRAAMCAYYISARGAMASGPARRTPSALRLDRRLVPPRLGRRLRQGRQAKARAERFLQHLVHVLDEDELQLLLDVGRNLDQVFFILLGDDHRLDPRTVCRDHLLLQAADRQHVA